MPKSLSAEHLGTVDQYYWDSFWSLAGLKALAAIAGEIGHTADSRMFESEANGLELDLLGSFQSVEDRLGEPLIPSTPFRPFDESAIGSVSCLYPLDLFGGAIPNPEKTLAAIVDRFIDDRGFYHPIIHSGYNAYLTLQVAHALLDKGDISQAWDIADSIFRQSSATCSYPEAIHPKTGGGAMGDGHHGWAAAEVVLFLRDCMVKERHNRIEIFRGAGFRLMERGKNLAVVDARTAFGTISVSLEFVTDNSFNIAISTRLFTKSAPDSIDVFFPWKILKISPSSPQHLIGREELPEGTKLRFSSQVSSALVHIDG